MAMGVVSDKDFDKEKSKLIREAPPKPHPNHGIINDLPSPGRGLGNKEVPNGLRQIIGETAALDRQEGLELAKNFGISPSSVSAYAHGSTSTKSYDQTPNLNHILGAKERISKKARLRLINALNAITPEKLAESKVVEAATVAKAMSGIIKDMEPDIQVKGEGGPTFVFYSPKVKEEKTFDVVFTKE